MSFLIKLTYSPVKPISFDGSPSFPASNAAFDFSLFFGLKPIKEPNVGKNTKAISIEAVRT